MKTKHLTLSDPLFPEPLRHIPSPPQELYFVGDLESMLAKPRLAVIGSRKITPYGQIATRQLAEAAVAGGVVIVSGLALGVDAAAHKTALENNGLKIAVLASGLDQISPRTNYSLAKKIIEQDGAIVSEYPDSVPALKQNFIARNRLVSGISDAILITEAAAKSGTMHTAAFALEQGRTVMAVPGNINSPYSEGTNNLIKAGAVPVTTPEDIFETMGLKSTVQQVELIPASPEEAIILNLLKNGVSDGSRLLEQSKLSTSTFNQTLAMLEVTGKIHSLGGNYWATG